MSLSKGILTLIIILFIISPVSADHIDLDLRTDKHIYGAGKNISVFGSLYDSELNQYIEGVSVNVSINDSTSIFTTDSNGKYAGVITAPASAGEFEIESCYNDSQGELWKSTIDIKVSLIEIDDIKVRPNRINYYPGESMKIVIKPIIRKSGTSMGVHGVEIEGTIRNPDNTIHSEFSGITDASGALVVKTKAPQPTGEYVIEVNDFVGQKAFNVVEYEVALNIKDGSGQVQKTLFSSGQEAVIEVKVTSNGSVPKKGTYSFTGKISHSNGTTVKNIPRASINKSNSYTGTYKFSLDASFASGAYVVDVTVERSGGTSVSRSASFEVRTWGISIEKASGFEFGYTGYPESEVSFKVNIKDISTGAAITTLDNNNFDIQVKTKTGESIGSYSTYYNSSLGYYPITFNLPSEVGHYTLAVQVSYSGDTQKVEGTLKVTDTVAYGTPVDQQGQYKEVFGSSEYIYIILEAENKTSSKKITNMELLRIVNEDGVAVSYQNTTWSGDNSSVFEWRKNLSVNIGGQDYAIIKLDNPKSGGLYRIEVLVNDGAAIARTKFLIDPFRTYVRTYKSPKEEGDSPRYQFDTKDGIVFSIQVFQSKHASGSALKGIERGYYEEEMFAKPVSGGGGGGASSTGEEVANATIRVVKIINDRIFEEIPLTDVNITYSGVTDANGVGEVTLIPATGTWDGGWYHVEFEITSPDSITTDDAHGGFEARAFYLYAWSEGKWMCQPKDNVTFNIEMFDAGSDYWWRSSKGLSGKVSVEKILYHGSPGEWLWPPVEYDYPLDNLKSITVKDGHGNFTLTSPSGGWDNGAYSFILKGTTDDGETDYGDGWFEVRQWEVWVSPVDESDLGWKEAFNLEENVTLYVNIFNAGSWKLNESLGGNITIDVKKIEDYSSWPPKTLDESEYKVYTVTVNESSTKWENPKSNHILEIEPVGNWTPGYYGVVIDVNGSETGYGWFETIAFFADASMVNENGSRIYSAADGPLYFNITTSKDSMGKSLIDTTIKEMKLSTWDRENGQSIKFTYPGNLTLDTTTVNGKATIRVDKAGSWSSGWYHGEIVLEDSEGATSTARVWFDIRPFLIRSYAEDWEIPSKANATLYMEILNPETYGTKEGNYSVTKIVDRTKYYEDEEELVYSPVNFTINGSTPNVSISISPPNGSWEFGYHSLMIFVRDDQGNREYSWESFRVVPFKAEVRSNKKVYKSQDDIVLNVTITEPGTGLPAQANISSIIEWGEYSEIEHSFSPSSVEGSKNVTISTPAGGWSEGYHDLTIILTDGSTFTEKWVWFEVRSYNGYTSQVNDNGYYVNGFMPNETVNLKLRVYLPDSDWRDMANVTVTGVKYSTDYGNYIDASWLIVNSSDNKIDEVGIIRLIHPGDWEIGEYDVEITVTGDEGDGRINGYFRIIDDLTPPVVTINSPIGSINQSTVVINVTTNEEANCYYFIHDTLSDYSYEARGELASTDLKIHTATVGPIYGGDYHLHADCNDLSWNYNGEVSTFSIDGFDIKIEYYTDDLDDDGDSMDNNFTTIDASFDLGDEISLVNTSDELYGINGGLKFDANSNDSLNDPVDYQLYNALYVLDINTVRPAYVLNMSGLNGSNITIKGVGYIVVEVTENSISLYDFNSTTAVINGSSDVSGFSTVRVNDTSFAAGKGSGLAVFLDPEVTILKGDRVDIPGTYHALYYSIAKYLDIRRMKNLRVESGTTLHNSDPLYELIVNDEAEEVKFTIAGTDIIMEYGLDDLDDDYSDDFFFEISKKGQNVSADGGDTINTSKEGELVDLNGTTMKFDENSDSDLKDAEDYPLYSGLFLMDKYNVWPYLDVVNATGVVDTTSSVNNATVFDASTVDSKGYGYLGMVMKLRGDKYIITKEWDIETASFAPLLRASPSSFGELQNPKDYAVTLTGTLKLAFKADGNYNGTLYFYDGDSPLKSLEIGGLSANSGSDYVGFINNTDLPDAFAGLKMFYKIPSGNTWMTVTAGDKSKAVTISNGINWEFGYDTIYLNMAPGNNPEFPYLQEGIYLMGYMIGLVPDDRVDIPDSYYQLELGNSSDLDLLRKKTASVANGAKLKHTVSAYARAIERTITVTIVPKG